MDLTTPLDRIEAAIAAFDVRRAVDSPLDVLIGLGLAFLAALGMYGVGAAPQSMAAVLLATAPQAVRRRHPWLSVGLTAVGAALLLAAPPPVGLWPVPVLVSGTLSFFTIQRSLGRRTAWLFTGVLVCLLPPALLFAVVAADADPYQLGGAAAGAAVLLVGTTMAADIGRGRTEVRQAKADNLEALREQAAMAERARIAREMHDIVAHSISMVAVQAETAPYTIPGLGDDARREFAEIAVAARGTLAEMRRLLGVLRADVPAETAPQPGLARLPELIEAHGGEVDLDVVGEARELPQPVDVSAYRIVQEALTNARVHAPGARVSIEIAYRPTMLVLRVADDGPGPAASPSGDHDDGPGHGVIGMRERAAALGGWLTAGGGPGGGFFVRAGLPTG
ncbi:sensor histidine kinase [Microbispora sp. ATCC PTA-5024]|uniref:sensor histidine kinase n=1 Tax=Microbispora sp. ATCC PTA-5024 TaxID=316330 RepID=UPI0003DC43E3|nr:histidine kinase [Microbispora sp. ATCC PTA-5024]ETK33511.1 hypothetical protein MPTA5024_24055 [Microbispora sp. ATCC PTA-5024]